MGVGPSHAQLGGQPYGLHNRAAPDPMSTALGALMQPAPSMAAAPRPGAAAPSPPPGRRSTTPTRLSGSGSFSPPGGSGFAVAPSAAGIVTAGSASASGSVSATPPLPTPGVSTGSALSPPQPPSAPFPGNSGAPPHPGGAAVAAVGNGAHAGVVDGVPTWEVGAKSSPPAAAPGGGTSRGQSSFQGVAVQVHQPGGAEGAASSQPPPPIVGSPVGTSPGGGPEELGGAVVAPGGETTGVRALPSSPAAAPGSLFPRENEGFPASDVFGQPSSSTPAPAPPMVSVNLATPHQVSNEIGERGNDTATEPVRPGTAAMAMGVSSFGSASVGVTGVPADGNGVVDVDLSSQFETKAVVSGPTVVTSFNPPPPPPPRHTSPAASPILGDHGGASASAAGATALPPTPSHRQVKSTEALRVFWE